MGPISLDQIWTVLVNFELALVENLRVLGYIRFDSTLEIKKNPRSSNFSIKSRTIATFVNESEFIDILTKRKKKNEIP